MIKLRNILYLLISIPAFIISVWMFAVPEDVVRDLIEDSVSNSNSPEIKVSITGIRKGFFFTLYADSLNVEIDGTPALKITEISSRINPLYLFKKQLAFSLNGEIGTGEITGFLTLPEKGTIKVERVEISTIPYVTYIGLKGSGLLSGNLYLKDNTVDVIFEIEDLNIKGLTRGMPLPLSLFNKIQGAFSSKGNILKVKSISLEGEKGYARLEGEVNNGFMNLTLELMPLFDKLESVESMLIEKYKVSPGYYVIPIKGPVFK